MIIKVILFIFITISDIDSNYLLILEYADSNTLRNYLKDNFNGLDWNMKLQFAIQTADAVSCMHQKDIIHRDLVSLNFYNNNNQIYYNINSILVLLFL